jgi:hypothetical protein
MNYFLIFLWVVLTPPLFTSSNEAVISPKQTINPCDVYGQIYVEKDRRRANFLVYIEPDNDFRAKLVVFEESNSLNADREGLWYFVAQRGFADYSICFVEDRGIADFIIYYTDKPHLAGCR